MQNNPYVGPRPYTRADRDNFYGRNREARDLLDMLIAERVVLFYAQSGAGKSSLLNARVIPDLETRGFRVLPPLRVGSDAPPGIDAAAVPNIFVFSTLLSLADPNTPPATLTGHTLLSFLQPLNLTASRHSGRSEESKRSEEFTPPILPILIWDQFEELFTTHRDRWEEATDFFEQVAAALENIPELGVVFVMREDHIAAIEPYAPLLPRRLRARFRMERLGYAGALEAIRKPALHAGCPFDESVAEHLADNLRRIKTQETASRTQETALGPYVEPVQLQVVCSRLWENLPEQADRLIQWEEVAQFGDVDQALTDFYEETLQQTCQISKKQAGPVITERTLRHWFGEELITPMQTRGLVMRSAESAGSLPNTAVDALEAAHIIRAEARAGARWYELCHDRLVEPVLQSNQAWEAARQTPLRLAAMQWQETKDNSLLYRGAALKDALRALEQTEVEPYERDFVAASRQAEQARIRRQRLTWIGAAGGAVVVILMTILTIFAINGQRAAKIAQAAAEDRRVEAEDAKATAEAERARSEEQTRIAFSRQLAAQAENEMNNLNPDLAQLLAIEAMKIQHLSEVQGQLRKIMAAPQATRWLLTGHQSSLRAVQWDPTGHFMATSDEDGLVKLWNAQTGKLVRDLVGHTARVQGMAWSADGASLLTAGWDNSARIWDVATGEQHFILEHPDMVDNVAWSHDQRRVATTCNDGLARVWDAATGELRLTLTGHENYVWRVAWNKDDSRILTAASDGSARIWDAHTGAELLKFAGHTDWVISSAWSPDERLLVTAGYDGLAKIWDAQTEELRLTLTGHTGAIRQAAWNKDGSRLLTVSDDATARVWNTETGAMELLLIGHTYQIQAGMWISDDAMILTASVDNTMRLWDAETGDSRAIMAGHRARIYDAALSPDNAFVLTGSEDQTARVWELALADVPRGELPIFSTHSSWGIQVMAMNASRRLLMVGDGDGVVHVWDVVAGVPYLTLNVPDNYVWHAAWSPDETRIAVAYDDGTARIWDAQTGEMRWLLAGHTAQVWSVAWNREGTRLLTVSADATACVWDAATGALLLTLTGHTDGIYDGGWSPAPGSDGYDLMVTASADHTARLWNAETGEPVQTLTGHAAAVQRALWSADAKRIVTISADGTGHIWDTATGQSLLSLEGHGGTINEVRWSPDGRRLLTSSADGTARIWDAATGATLGILQDHSGEVLDAVWDANGRRILTSSEDGTARLWDVAALGVAGAPPFHSLTTFAGHTEGITYVAWNTNESRVFTASDDGDVRQFYVAVDDLLTAACQQTLRNMTPAEWERVMNPHGPYQATCPNLPGKE